jgi:hypothetical protein
MRVCRGSTPAGRLNQAMGKLILELLIAIFLHPLAFILALINIVGRNDLNGVQKILWVVICIFWGIGPILYMVLSNGELW